jgi:hypothetical protein
MKSDAIFLRAASLYPDSAATVIWPERAVGDDEDDEDDVDVVETVGDDEDDVDVGNVVDEEVDVVEV